MVVWVGTSIQAEKIIVHFLGTPYNLSGVPVKLNPDRRGKVVSHVYKEYCKKMEIKCSSTREHIGTQPVERTIQTLHSFNEAILQDKIAFTDCLSQALMVVLFTIYLEMEVSTFQLHDDRKPRTKVTNIVKSSKS